MGYRLDRTYVLEFEGDMQGCEIKIKGTSAGVARKLREMDGKLTALELADLLASHIVSWNVETEDGKLAEHGTGEQIMDVLEEVELAAIIREWYKAAIGVTAPLDARSTSIGRALEDSIPMESELQPI